LLITKRFFLDKQNPRYSDLKFEDLMEGPYLNKFYSKKIAYVPYGTVKSYNLTLTT
jgi:hypothetical protein